MELEDITTESYKTGKQNKDTNTEKRNRISKNCGQLQKYNKCVMEIPDEEREKGTEGIFETIMTEDFPKLMSDTELQS